MPICLATTQNGNKKKSRIAALEFQDFPEIYIVFQDLCLLPRLSRTRILNNKIPGLSRVCMNPDHHHVNRHYSSVISCHLGCASFLHCSLLRTLIFQHLGSYSWMSKPWNCNWRSGRCQRLLGLCYTRQMMKMICQYTYN